MLHHRFFIAHVSSWNINRFVLFSKGVFLLSAIFAKLGHGRISEVDLSKLNIGLLTFALLLCTHYTDQLQNRNYKKNSLTVKHFLEQPRGFKASLFHSSRWLLVLLSVHTVVQEQR